MSNGLYEFGHNPRQLRWLIEPYVPTSAFMMVVGEPRSGKTASVLTIAARVACHHHDNVTLMPQKSVVVYVGDGRLIDREAECHFDNNGGDRRLLTVAQCGHALRWDVIYKLEKIVRARQAKLLIVDEIDDLLGAIADGHSRSPVCTLSTALEETALKTGLAVLIVSRHKSNKLIGRRDRYWRSRATLCARHSGKSAI